MTFIEFKFEKSVINTLVMLSRYRDRDRDFPGFTDPDQSRDPEIYRDRD